MRTVHGDNSNNNQNQYVWTMDNGHFAALTLVSLPLFTMAYTYRFIVIRSTKRILTCKTHTDSGYHLIGIVVDEPFSRL